MLSFTPSLSIQCNKSTFTSSSTSSSTSTPTSTPTFAAPGASTRPSKTCICHRIRPRASSTPSTSTPVSASASISQLKQRSVIALRALCDLGGIALVNELSHRFSLSGTASLHAIMSDCELLLGGLIGVWTAAAFAERLSNNVTDLKKEAIDLPNMWDKSFIYSGTGDELDADEISATIGLLYSFDEMEGYKTIELLKSLALSNDPLVRLRLVHALGSYPIRSNVTFSIIVTLLKDPHPLVRKAALMSLSRYESTRIVTSNDLSALLPTSTPTSQDLISNPSSLSSPTNLAAIKSILKRVANDPAPIPVYSVYQLPSSSPAAPVDESSFQYIFAKQIDYMKHMALTCPDLPNISDVATSMVRQPQKQKYFNSSTTHRPFEQQQQRQLPIAIQVSSSTTTTSNSQPNTAPTPTPVPLIDSLFREEIHGICALAIIPTAYEVMATIQHESLPLRFVGLGWLFAVGGLAAYPNSANLWSSFSQMIEQLSNHREPSS